MSTLSLTVVRCPEFGSNEQRQVHGGELTLGRGTECEWPLPDPQKSLSRKHCKLEFLAGAWQVRDLSVNGTFVNASPQPIGRNQAQALRDGDRLQLGSYEIEVRLLNDDATQYVAPAAPQPWAQAPGPGPAAAPGAGFFGDAPSAGFAATPLPGLDSAPAPDFGQAASRSSGSPPAAGSFADHSDAMSDAFVPPKVASAGQPLVPDNWWDLGDDVPGLAPVSAPAPAPAQVPVQIPVQAPPPMPPVAAPVAAPPVAPAQPIAAEPASGLPPFAPPSPVPVPAQARAAQPANGDMAAALAAFFEGSGLSPDMIGQAGADPQAALRHAGALLRVAVGGVRSLLVARGRVKREFRIEQTLLQSKENNQLKFAASDEQALMALLNPQPRALQALSDAVNDLNLHQVAVLAATQAASRALLDRLEPDNIEVVDQGKGLRLFADSQEKRLWEAYKLRHANLIEQFEDDFESAFGVAFAKAYEQAVGRSRN